MLYKSWPYIAATLFSCFFFFAQAQAQQSDDVAIQGVIDQTGKQWQAVYTMKQQEDGTWKITGVKIDPTQGAAT